MTVRHPLSPVIAVGMVAFAAYAVYSWVVDLQPGGWLPQNDVLLAALNSWLFVIGLVGGVGLWRVGAVVDAEELRLRGVFRTRRFSRSEVTDVKVARVGLFGGKTIAVETRDGTLHRVNGLESPIHLPVWISGKGLLRLEDAARMMAAGPHEPAH